MNYIGNAFSLQMLDTNAPWNISVCPVAPENIPAEIISCIGHPDTAAVVSAELGRNIPSNRISVHLLPGDTLYVAQFIGGRLPEGATRLPKGFTINYLRVFINDGSACGSMARVESSGVYNLIARGEYSDE